MTAWPVLVYPVMYSARGRAAAGRPFQGMETAIDANGNSAPSASPLTAGASLNRTGRVGTGRIAGVDCEVVSEGSGPLTTGSAVFIPAARVSPRPPKTGGAVE